jgi:hypothetical protein
VIGKVPIYLWSGLFASFLSRPVAISLKASRKMPMRTLTVSLINTWQVFSEIVRALYWGYTGFRLGLIIGFLGGLVAALSFNYLIVFAFAVPASIIALLLALLYRERRAVRLRNLWEMLIGFSTGAIVVFIAALYYFLLTFLAIVTIGVVSAGYNFFETRGAMKEASIELRHLIRNIYVLIAIMVPLLFFVILIIGPNSSPIPILAWAFAYSLSSLIVLGRFLRERRDRWESG